MKYIKEYHIFDFLKKKKKVSSSVSKDISIKKKNIFTKFSEDLISNGKEQILFYKMYSSSIGSYSSSGELTPSQFVVKKSPELGYLMMGHKSDRNYYSVWSWPVEDKDRKFVKCNLDDLDNDLTKLNLVQGGSVKIIDNKINGYITQIWVSLFSKFNLSVDIKESGVLSKVLEIIGLDGEKYYRLPNQVVSTDDISELSLSEVFEEEIRDYLTDIDESQKFNIVITKKIVDRVGIVNFMVEIKFKEGIENSLETLSLFFRNINTLKKRINAINGYDFEIEDLHKRGILLKIFNLKKFEGIFWNKHKDNDIGDKIFKNLDNLKSSDITLSSNGYNCKIFNFDIQGFKIMVRSISRRSEWGTPNIIGYNVSTDGVSLDISDKKSKNIYNKVDAIYRKEEIDRELERKKKNKEDEDYTKKDLRISLRENMSKGECDICGEDIYTDDRICDDCKMNKDEIEFDDTKIHLEEPPQTLPAYPMSQNIYFENSQYPNLSQQDIDYISDIFTMEIADKLYLKKVNIDEFFNSYDNLLDETLDPCYFEEVYNNEDPFIIITILYTGTKNLNSFKRRLGNNYHVSDRELDFKSKSGNTWTYVTLKIRKKGDQKFEKYEFEDFTAVDMDLVKDLYEDGMIDPKEIHRELDFRNLSIEQVEQIIFNLKKSNQIK